jgi:hypothetical protein
MTDPLKQWLAVLANLYGPYRAEAAAAFNTYVPMLKRDFTHEAFTPQSAAHVARQCPSVPTYGKLCTALAEWWQDNRPQAPRLPAPAPATDPERDQWRAMSEEARDAAIAAVKAKYGPLQRYQPAPDATPPKPIKARPLKPEELAAARAAQGIRIPGKVNA